MKKINGEMVFTKKEMFAQVINALKAVTSDIDGYMCNGVAITDGGYDIPADTMINFLEKEIEFLNKKSANRSTSKSQKATTEDNNKILILVCDFLNTVEKATVTEILENSSDIASYTTVDGKKISNQKLSAVLRNGITQGIIKKEIEKKTSYFSLA